MTKSKSIQSSVASLQLRTVAKRAIGFSLIEVMLAILVIGVAGLGAAALSLSGLRESHTSNHRAIAVELASDLLERLKTNPKVLTSDYLPAGLVASTPKAGTPNAACYDPELGCDPASRAQNDLYEWASAVNDRLPGGTAVFCHSAKPAEGTPDAPGCDADLSSFSPLVIKFWWNERAVLDPLAADDNKKVQDVPQLSAPLYYVAVGL
jgi:type IV pilus assembly protein PilV